MKPPPAEIIYTTDGSDPRLPGGKRSSQAKALGDKITLVASGTIKARAFAQNQWGALAAHAFEIDPSLPANVPKGVGIQRPWLWVVGIGLFLLMPMIIKRAFVRD